MTDSEKMNLILAKIDNLDEKLTTLDGKVDTLDGKVDRLDSRVSNLESDMKTVKQDIIKLNTVIEGEIRVNIQRIAEGHLDLARNLHEAMKPNAEVEMLAIKVSRLESDVTELKQKIS